MKRAPGRLAGLLGVLAVTLAVPVSSSATVASARPAPLVIVMLENESYSAVMSSSSMPYLKSLWDSGTNEDLTHYYGVAHTSLHDYLAMAAGNILSRGESIRPGQFHVTSVWDQLTRAGVSWGIYQEAMPSVCYAGYVHNDNASDGQYQIGHNPGIGFSGVYGSAECQNIKPLTSMNPASLPAVSFVTPNICDDFHGFPKRTKTSFKNCVTSTAALAKRSDTWLAKRVAQWVAGGATVLITFDEGTGTAGPGKTKGAGQVYAVLTGHAVSPGKIATGYNHYSVLAGVEQAYGLSRLGNAAKATPLAIP